MPFYDYECKTCQHVQEVRHNMNDKPRVKCEKCDKPCKKLIAGTSGVLMPGREIWEYNDIRKSNPKWLKSRDGKTRVRYDPTKHGQRKGSG